jgi:hypothetical protein
MLGHHLKPASCGWGRVKPLGSVIRAAALTTLGVRSFSATRPDNATVDIPLAGSGSAPVNTSFSQPVVGGMSMGNTVTATTRPSPPVVSTGFWDFDFDGDPNIVEVYVRRLRTKLQRPDDGALIETVRGARVPAGRHS